MYTACAGHQLNSFLMDGVYTYIPGELVRSVQFYGNISGWGSVQLDRVHSLRPFQDGAGSNTLLEQKTLED